MFHAEIEATNHCNTRCIQCPHESISRPRGRMELATFETIVTKIKAHTKGEKFSISFSGMGEPMLNPLIYDFIKLVSKDAFTGFATNAAALTENNVQKLMESGLDVIYVSFNGDEPTLFSKMMGGLSFDKIGDNLRNAISLTKGSRLKINANVSVTKLNRGRVTKIKDFLENEGVHAITYSMCHSRGGNLKDPEVYDTPAQPEDDGRCDVLKNTLFVDWRGKVFICDHDIHGEYGYGDLVTEPLEIILERREKLLDAGLSFEICKNCHDLLKVGFQPLESQAGGRLPDWIYDLYKAENDGLSHATSGFKWLYAIYQKEDRLDRLVNRLLLIEKNAALELKKVKSENLNLQKSVGEKEDRISELDREIRTELAKKDKSIAELTAKITEMDGRIQKMRRTRTWRVRSIFMRMISYFNLSAKSSQ